MCLVDRESGADGTAGVVDVVDAGGDRFAVFGVRAEVGAKLRRRTSQSNEPRKELSSREKLVGYVGTCRWCYL